MTLRRLQLLIASLLLCSTVYAQEANRPSFSASKKIDDISLDAKLDEESWKQANVLETFQTIVPEEGGVPSLRTTVRVVAGSKKIYIGIVSYEDQPEGIVSFSKLRDSDLEEEDHVRVVLDPYLDGQSGIIFAVNANGARYDALVANRGESENSDWDAVWYAKTEILEDRWIVEIEIPIQSFPFNKNLREWGFNVERRIQRNLETIRWANIKRDQWFAQTSRAGLLTNIPEFDYGLGLNVRPSLIENITRDAGEDAGREFDPSLDINQRIGANNVATLTFNTDFAETDVDSRQTNLTRFPLFFPERRAFFLEGADIFEFGFGLGRSIIPFFSRRIGLQSGNPVPVNFGGKVNGRLGKTSYGGLVMQTNETSVNGNNLPTSTMGVVRVKQNVLKESSIGFIGTYGDPQGRADAGLVGMDFTYQTTRFNGDKNFLVGFSGMYSEREDLDGDQSAFGMKIDYPNDIWDVAFTYLRIGDAFDPSLGFVPRPAINSFSLGGTYAPRPDIPWLRQMRNQLFFRYVTDLDGNWESWRVFTAPINWRLESGDVVEFNIVPQGEQLVVPFQISDDVDIPPGAYNFNRFRVETILAAKRKINGQLTYWFGTFYGGDLNEYEASMNINPSATFNMELNVVHNVGSLPQGDFTQTLTGFRFRYNASPDLQLNSFIQYDNESEQIGVNARIHWIFHPQGDLFFVYNQNTFNGFDRWELLNQQLVIKVRYNFRL